MRLYEGQRPEHQAGAHRPLRREQRQGYRSQSPARPIVWNFIPRMERSCRWRNLPSNENLYPMLTNSKELADYRVRVQRVFDAHNRQLRPSPSLLRACFSSGIAPKEVYNLVGEIADEWAEERANTIRERP